MGIKREKINPRLCVEVCATKTINLFSLAVGDCIAQRKAGEIWLKGPNFIFLFFSEENKYEPCLEQRRLWAACLELHDWTFLRLQLGK